MRIRIRNPNSFMWIRNPESFWPRIRDPSRSEISPVLESVRFRDKNPGSATLIYSKKLSLFWMPVSYLIFSFVTFFCSKPLTFVRDKSLKKEAIAVFKLVQIYMSDRYVYHQPLCGKNGYPLTVIIRILCLSAALYLTLSGIEVCNAWFMRCTLVLVVEVKVRRGNELSFSMVSTLRTAVTPLYLYVNRGVFLRGVVCPQFLIFCVIRNNVHKASFASVFSRILSRKFKQLLEHSWKLFTENKSVTKRKKNYFIIF